MPQDSHAPENDWMARAHNVIPRISSTGSKRPEAIYGDADSHGPTHFVRANGCRVETADGLNLIDSTMALGAVALGYADPAVTEAVNATVRDGNVSGLNHTLEVEVAELLCDVIPCAEKVQFLKTGAEAMAAAVRLARAVSNRDEIVACGYFGWLDWCSEPGAGVPANSTSNTYRVPFNDIDALAEVMSAHEGRIAAVVLEPVIESLPSHEWLSAARELCDAEGTYLIFDEIKTGFRFATGGYQQLAGVTPDLATFGKAMANGFPLAVVCGKQETMDAARGTWISSTLAGEASSLAAAKAVLQRHGQTNVCDGLADRGNKMCVGLEAALVEKGAEGVRIAGTDRMWMLEFDDPQRESRFLKECAARGVLFKRGAYNFPALAHDDNAIQTMLEVAAHSLASLADPGKA